MGRPTRPHILVEPSPSKCTANKEENGSILGWTNNNSHVRRDRTKKILFVCWSHSVKTIRTFDLYKLKDNIT